MPDMSQPMEEIWYFTAEMGTQGVFHFSQLVEEKQVLIFQFYYSTDLFFLVHRLHGRGLLLSKQLLWDGIL